jgi:hypothetical protein
MFRKSVCNTDGPEALYPDITHFLVTPEGTSYIAAKQWDVRRFSTIPRSRHCRPLPHVSDRFEQVKLSSAVFPLQQKRQRSYTKMQQDSFIAALNYRTTAT